MKTILSLVSVLSLSLAACVADPSDDLGHPRDLRVDDTHGALDEGLDNPDAPSLTDDTHGALDEAMDDVDSDDANDVTAMPQPLTATR
ncbi:MAG TPA: hypothetical protein VGM39_02055 [Kofleriaceae bacterium]|jgi:hypothetical protein